ncbi:hypothetical protein [Actinoplanes solisilvae]|uniref:hypothetical protein n=1 Tax=Actinoplanes solisilvae TaxID=2486853 RepID=UPI000FDC659B|nr:hypothetical protein [Actinoplanes solisilvae]
MTPTPNTTGGGRRRWDAGIRAGVISAIVGVLALVVALLTWLVPREPGDESPANAQVTAVSQAPEPTPQSAGQPPVNTATVYLTSDQFQPESGADDLMPVPRAIKGKAGYTGHEMAVRCPTNETGDPTSEITYLLQGRYVQFDVTVHPYFPARTDQQAVTFVTALIAVRRNDGGLDTRIAGDQKTSGPNRPAGLSASVEGAEKLILRIECGNPNGTVVLTEARLTPA